MDRNFGGRADRVGRPRPDGALAHRPVRGDWYKGGHRVKRGRHDGWPPKVRRDEQGRGGWMQRGRGNQTVGQQVVGRARGGRHRQGRGGTALLRQTSTKSRRRRRDGGATAARRRRRQVNRAPQHKWPCGAPGGKAKPASATLRCLLFFTRSPPPPPAKWPLPTPAHVPTPTCASPPRPRPPQPVFQPRPSPQGQLHCRALWELAGVSTSPSPPPLPALPRRARRGPRPTPPAHPPATIRR